MEQRSDQPQFWDERADAWDRNVDALEGFLRQFSDPAIDVLEPKPGHHVADVGCGPGLTTQELARRVGPDGSATGVDTSSRMVEVATARAEASDVANARFVVGDPGTGPIGSFDGIFSRFGVMFFEDPPTAFRNLASSLAPGGRFVAVVWAQLDANPWMFVPTMVAAGPLGVELTPPAPDEPGPFSLADPSRTVPLLESSGFRDVAIERRHGQWAFEAVDESIERLLELGPLGSDWVAADREARAAAVGAVRTTFDEHRAGDVWQLPASAIVISASAGP